MLVYDNLDWYRALENRPEGGVNGWGERAVVGVEGGVVTHVTTAYLKECDLTFRHYELCGRRNLDERDKSLGVFNTFYNTVRQLKHNRSNVYKTMDRNAALFSDEN